MSGTAPPTSRSAAEFGIGVLGVGRYVPARVVTNADVEARTGLAAGTIVAKTGIVTRHVAADSETASGMSAAAAREALAHARIDPDEIGLVVGCTFTGDYVYPAMACKVQELIGARRAGAFDLLANCTGFQVGLTVAADWLRQDGRPRYAVVLGTALQSRFVRWDDPESAMYFGDGAGAAVLGRVPAGYGVLATEVFTNPTVFDSARLRGGGSSFPLRPENVGLGLQYHEINGLEVWKQVIQHQPRVIRDALQKVGYTTADVDFFVFHQANLRLIEYLMGKLRQPMAKTHTNVEELGNTADASLAITLCDAVRHGLVRRDHLVVVSGVGAGFTFGATVLRWY